MVCYWGSWSAYRLEDGYFGADHVNPFLCTHLVYGFAGLDEITYRMISLDPHNDLHVCDAPSGKNGKFPILFFIY